MNVRTIEVSHNGRPVSVSAVDIDGATVVASGTFPRIASIQDESFVEEGVPRDPARLIQQIVNSGLPADVVSFAQHIDDATPRFPYYFEWDNVAAADTTNYKAWWEKLPQSTRKNSRRSAREGVVTKVVPFDEQVAKGIKALYDESPLRQGRRFWHYGKDLATVAFENSSYLDRSDFIGAYFNDQLIGFMKFVYVGRIARIMQILASVTHQDKRPMNALIAKAVEVCHARNVTHLVYSKFQYTNDPDNPLTQFKMRNGFDRLDFPRYYAPVTIRGRVAVGCRLHRGLREMLPQKFVVNALRARASINQLLAGHRNRIDGRSLEARTTP